jgi:hypothetical protein
MEKAGVCGVPVVGVASSEWDDEQLRSAARAAVDERFDDIDEVAWKALAGRMTYVSGDYRESSSFENLAQQLAGVERPLFYLAIPPSMFDDVIQGLADVGLNGRRLTWPGDSHITQVVFLPTVSLGWHSALWVRSSPSPVSNSPCRSHSASLCSRG